MNTDHTAGEPPPPEVAGGNDHVQRQRSPDPLGLSELIAAGDIDVVPGDPPVPIAVWRVAEAGAAADRSAVADSLTPRMAALLVASYTAPGDTVVSVGGDPALAGAAGAGGRTYLTVRDLDDLLGLDHAAGTVTLIVLPWPPSGTRSGRMNRADLIRVFRACHGLMRPNGCTVVALAELPPEDTFVEHSSALIPAAHRAGLGWLQHVVAITAPIAGDRITWQPGSTAHASEPTAARVAVHMDLLVFAVRRPHRG